ncbi:MAG TPA: FGGY-family carbohydrate kinase [Acidimicrobiales bacterium]
MTGPRDERRSPRPQASATAEPPGEPLVVAVDLGTSSLKVGVATVTGRLVWRGQHPVATRREGRAATQDAESWWRTICDALRARIADGTVPADRIVAVACGGQWASTVPVDEKGNPVGDCVLWQDHRGARHAHGLVGGPVAGYAPLTALRWVRRTGGVPGGNMPVAHMLRIEREEPELAAATRWYLEPVDFLTMRFTGEATASHASMVASWLTDNRRLDRLAYDADLVRRAGVDPAKLPPLRLTGSVVGTVAEPVATDIGLPSGVAVVTGMPDLHTSTVGAGTVEDFQVHVSVSTSAWIGGPVPFKKTDVLRQIASVPGIGDGSYLIANSHDTGGQCLQWLRDNLLAPDDALAGPGSPGRDVTWSFDDLTALAAGAPPGSGGVLFTPWLLGEKSPVEDRHARAGFHNLSLATTRAHLVRAVMEGVAYNDRWLHEAVERFAGRRLDPVRFVGGGALSDLWCQIHADVLDRTVERVEAPVDANLRGAALLAGVALGLVRRSEVRELVPVDRTFTPEPGGRAVYARLYAEFPGLYSSQKAMFARLNRRPRRGGDR